MTLVVSGFSPTATDPCEGRHDIEGRAPRGLRIIPGFATDAQCAAIDEWVRAHVSWTRRSPDGTQKKTWLRSQESLPPWADLLGRRMAESGIFDSLPDYLHLIAYPAGNGIRPHVDREDLGEVVAGLTLGSSRVMEFTHPRCSTVRALLLPGDLYVIEGEARYEWEHAVPYTRVDRFKGCDVPRTNGLSATWRLTTGLGSG